MRVFSLIYFLMYKDDVFVFLSSKQYINDIIVYKQIVHTVPYFKFFLFS